MLAVSTSRMVLRPYREVDWDNFRELVQDEKLMAPLAGAHSDSTARALFDRLLLADLAAGLLGWAVTDITSHYLGHIFLTAFLEPERSVEIGFIILPRFQGHGFATEAARAIATFAFDKLRCRKVRATVDDDNAPCRRVLAHLGMREVARKRDTAGEYLVYELAAAGATSGPS